MNQNVLIPLLIGCFSLISAFVFSVIPLREEILKMRRELKLNNLILGLYNLLLSLITFTFNIDMLIVLYLIIGGVFLIGLLTMIPLFIKTAKELKNNRR